MKLFLFSAAAVYLSTALVCAAPSSGRAQQAQSQSEANKPATQSSTSTTTQTPAPASADQDKTKKKPKKVWTNDEISTVSGGISVVGDSSASSGSAQAPKKSSESDSDGGGTAKEKQVAAYRDQIQKLRAQIDAADKKINDLRNFKADNTSPTGGINMNKGYNMTPLEDQVKQLEEQKKQIQAKIEALEDEARKNGIEAGELR
jgi:chromosome segregation ATPase